MTDFFGVLDGNFKWGCFLQNQAVIRIWADVGSSAKMPLVLARMYKLRSEPAHQTSLGTNQEIVIKNNSTKPVKFLMQDLNQGQVAEKLKPYLCAE